MNHFFFHEVRSSLAGHNFSLMLIENQKCFRRHRAQMVKGIRCTEAGLMGLRAPMMDAVMCLTSITAVRQDM